MLPDPLRGLTRAVRGRSAWLRASVGHALLAGAFLVFAGLLFWRLHTDETERQRQDLTSSAQTIRENLRQNLQGNEDYLRLLAAEWGRGNLGAAQFQQRVAPYVAAHAELINVTRVDADFLIRDVVPLEGNRQIIGLRLDLPEPKRAATLARERREPVYTRPFEAIQGPSSFEVWMPVFRGDEFVGLLAAVYSSPTLLQKVVPAALGQRHHVEMRDASGGLLASSALHGGLDPRLRTGVDLSPPGYGVSLRVHAYGSGWSGLFVLEVLCGALALGMAYSLLALKRDVTRRQASERELRASEERWKFALEGAGDGVWDWDLRRGHMLYSRRFKEMLGFADDEIGCDARTWEELIHPDSKALVLACRDDCLSGRAASFSVEYRLRCKNDGWIWVLGRGRVVSRDETGAAVRMIGTQADITHRKGEEAALRMAALVYQHSNEAMAVTDGDNNVVAVNAAFTRMTGYEADEVLGRNPPLFSSDQHDAAFYELMWQAIREHGHWQGELSDRRKSGEVFVAWGSINTIANDDGSVHRHVMLFSDITEKKKSEDLIWQQANFDALTGLPNRSMFQERLQYEIRKNQRLGQGLAVLFIDLDQFKEVNDTLGHDKGDLLLVEAACRIRNCVRQTDTVARMGGDEFTVILPQLDLPDCTERIAGAIVETLSAPFELGEEKAYVSASIGITFYPGDATEIEDLLRHADQAMYAAKSLGRNRFSYFTPALQDAAQNRMRLANDLRVALADQQFRVYFQPIVELATGSIHKAEALIRWQHPRRGLVSPAEFIPLAESIGLIADIGDWVFRESVSQAKRWRAEFHPGFQISVNTSPAQFRHEVGLNRAFFDHLQASELTGHGIAIEITEGLLLDASPHVSDVLLAFRDRGIQVSLDDFGTGYSSLSYLQRFDIDYLKIDQSFVRNLAPQSADMTLCEAIIVMAHKLGLMVVAEGIETERQRELLTSAKCDYGQGYLFSRPLPPEEFEARLLQAPRVAGEPGPHALSTVR